MHVAPSTDASRVGLWSFLLYCCLLLPNAAAAAVHRTLLPSQLAATARLYACGSHITVQLAAAAAVASAHRQAKPSGGRVCSAPALQTE